MITTEIKNDVALGLIPVLRGIGLEQGDLSNYSGFEKTYFQI